MTQPQKQSSCCTNPLNEEASPETEVLNSLHETMKYIQQGDRHAVKADSRETDMQQRDRLAAERQTCLSETDAQAERQMHSRGYEKLVCGDQLRAWGPLWR